MLSRIVKLIEARRALRSGRLHEALSIAEDAAIRDDRRAREIRESARDQLLLRAEQRRARGELSGALLDLRCVLSAAPEDDRRGRDLEESLRAELGARDEVRELERAAVEEARAQLARGWLHEARVRLAPHITSLDAAARLAREIDERLARADAELDRADEALRRGEVELAREAHQRLRGICRQHPGADRIERELRRRELAEVLARAGSAQDEDELERIWEELSSRVAEHRDLEPLPEIEHVRTRLSALRAERLRTELLRGDPAAIGAASRRWLALDRAAGEELPAELAGAVEAIADAVVLAELGVARAPQARLRRASGGAEVEAALLQVGVRLQREARALDEFVARGRRAMEHGDLSAWKLACSGALASFPATRVFAELLAAVGDGAPSACGEEPGAALDRGRALACLVEILRSGRARDPLAAQAWERLDRTRVETETTLAALASGALDAEEAARCAQRCSALDLLAGDSPWLGLARRTVDAAVAMAHAHTAVRAPLAAGDLLAVEQCLERAAAEADARRAAGCETGLVELLHRRIERDRRSFARAVRASFDRSGWSPLLPWLGASPSASAEAAAGVLRGVWNERLAREQARLRVELERRRAAGEPLSNAEWERARLLLPGDPVLEGLHDRTAEHAALDERVRRAEWLSDRRDFSGAWDELRTIEDAGPFRTRIFDLKRRVQRERGLGQRFFLRVEEGGEYLVLLHDRVRIGNARVPGNDLPILANISSHHAEIERTTSFHGGTRYVVKGLEARPVFVGGAAVPPEGSALRDGDVLRFGVSLEMSFHQPSPRSQSAVLRLRDGFDVQGVERVILLKSGGKSGRLVCGPEECSHLRAPKGIDLELWVDEEERLRGRSGSPWKIDGHAVGSSEPVLPSGAWVESAGLRFAIDPG